MHPLLGKLYPAHPLFVARAQPQLSPFALRFLRLKAAALGLPGSLRLLLATVFLREEE